MNSVKIHFVVLLNLASVVAYSETLEQIQGSYNNSDLLSNPVLMNECEENCVDQLIDCLSSCETVECETECRRAEVDCFNDCSYEKDVLVLSTYSYSNVPMIISFDGKDVIRI